MRSHVGIANRPGADGNLTCANNISILQQVDILLDIFMPKLRTIGQANATRRPLKQCSRVDSNIECAQLGGVDVFRTNDYVPSAPIG